MLTKEDNEAITQVGPGTLMGNLMREYWIPAMLSSELPNSDSDPLRVLLLGEKLIGFRDTSGRVGLIQNLCPHRGSSLFLGRNEEDGIRCVYHGWKFDVTGACVDMPNEPRQSNFKSRIRAIAYPCVERAGIVWTYMGPRETPPPLPDIEGAMLPEGDYTVDVAMRPCNWLQALEGDIDTVHAAFLHGGALEPDWYPEGTMTRYELESRPAQFVAVDTDYGTLYGAFRPAGPGRNYWRIGKFMLPFWTSPGAGVLGIKIQDRAWVPMDDHHTLIFTMGLGARAQTEPDPNYPPELQPNSTDWLGRFRTVYGPENDYFIDREEQRELGNFTGMPAVYGNGPEDAAVQVYMDPVLDRTIEHLGTSDLMIVHTRQRLLEAARALAEHKANAPGVDTPEIFAVRAGGCFIPEGEDWLTFIQPLLTPFTDHPEVDAGVYGRAGTGSSRIRGRRHQREKIF